MSWKTESPNQYRIRDEFATDTLKKISRPFPQKRIEKILILYSSDRIMENSLQSREKIETAYTIKLNPVCEIIPKKDKSGQIFEYDFQDEINGITGLKFSQYGKGPFCRFSLPQGYSGKSGVYFIFDNASLRYIGECVNLETRFNMGYGIIELRNCLHKGQQTNCRINNLILDGVKNQNRFFLFFHETLQRKDLESRLISNYHPPWNRTHTNNSQPPFQPQKQTSPLPIFSDKITIGGKYEALFTLLKGSENNDLLLTFSKIESLLGFTLPSSAYKYQAWLANDNSHSHAKAWLNAGWKVTQVKLGTSVKFSKK